MSQKVITQCCKAQAPYQNQDEADCRPGSKQTGAMKTFEACLLRSALLVSKCLFLEESFHQGIHQPSPGKTQSISCNYICRVVIPKQQSTETYKEYDQR